MHFIKRDYNVFLKLDMVFRLLLSWKILGRGCRVVVCICSGFVMFEVDKIVRYLKVWFLILVE